MRRAVILALLTWLVVAGLSSWAFGDSPGWLPDDFRRGGGDELESAARLDPDGLEDEIDCAMAPPSAAVLMESGSDVRPGSVTSAPLLTKSNRILWWVYSVFRRW